MRKFKDTYKKGTRVETCFYPELPDKTGTVINTFHDYDTQHGYHTEWVKVKLDDGTTKYIPSCFVRDVTLNSEMVALGWLST